MNTRVPLQQTCRVNTRYVRRYEVGKTIKLCANTCKYVTLVLKNDNYGANPDIIEGTEYNTPDTAEFELTGVKYIEFSLKGQNHSTDIANSGFAGVIKIESI